MKPATASLRWVVVPVLLVGLVGAWLLRTDSGPSEGSASLGRETERTAPPEEALLAAARGRTPPSGVSREGSSSGEAAASRQEPALGGPVRVTLDLRLPDGSPPDVARVYRGGVGEGGEPRRWTPGVPEIDLDARPTRFAILAGRFGEWRVEGLEIAASPGARVRVDLRPHPMIVGRVLPADGDELFESDVQATLLRRQPPDPEASSDDELPVQSTLVRKSAEGWFAFGVEEALAPGSYEVTATPWRFGPVRATARVEVDKGPANVVLQLPRVQPAEGVTIRVFDPRGAVVSPRLVTLDLMDDAGGGRGGGCTFHGRSDGSVWIPTALTLEPGRRWTDAVLWIHTELGVKALRLPRVFGNDEIRVGLEQPSALTVELDDRPSWMTDVGVRLVASHPFSPGTRTVVATGRAALEGAARLEPVQPGTYALTLAARADGWDLTLELGDVDARSGPQRIVGRLPPLYRMEIQHAGGPLGIYRVGRSWDNAQWTAAPREAGSVLAPGLPEGEYEVRQGGKATRVRLPTAAVRLR